jgi:hypothetical protein
MDLDRAKLITLLLTAGLLVVASFVEADENVKPLFRNSGQGIERSVSP